MSDHACTLTFVPRISAGRSKGKSGYALLDLVVFTSFIVRQKRVLRGPLFRAA